jgi:hypothetical protein
MLRSVLDKDVKTIIAILCLLLFATGTDYIEGGYDGYVEPAYVLVEYGVIFILDEGIIPEGVIDVMSRM